jgi:hypothetical protein
MNHRATILPSLWDEESSALILTPMGIKGDFERHVKRVEEAALLFTHSILNSCNKKYFAR